MLLKKLSITLNPKMSIKIPFNKPFFTGEEIGFINEAHDNGQLGGDGRFTRLCSEWLEKVTEAKKVLLTHSCTAALEIAAILADIQSGDEIIMPSYTFTSTANAFVMRGGIPVFVDIRSDTFNIDENLIEQAISKKTKAIVVVHYAGVACEMDQIMEISHKYKLLVIEDAAQAILSTYKGRPLGSIGHLGCYSFHETKNISSGEGGALLVNESKFIERAEIIREKGTNRTKFFRGEVAKYTWEDIGSSYLMGELTAAFLWAQIKNAHKITDRRVALWNSYHNAFKKNKRIRLPILSTDASHNGHLYYLLFSSLDERSSFIAGMRDFGISCVFHYVPLHSSPKGLKCCRISGDLAVTSCVSDRLVRLPLWVGLEDMQLEIISSAKYLLRDA